MILALIGAVIWKKDEDAIEVMTQSGDMKNVLWAKLITQDMPFLMIMKLKK